VVIRTYVFYAVNPFIDPLKPNKVFYNF